MLRIHLNTQTNTQNYTNTPPLFGSKIEQKNGFFLLSCFVFILVFFFTSQNGNAQFWNIKSRAKADTVQTQVQIPLLLPNSQQNQQLSPLQILKNDIESILNSNDLANANIGVVIQSVKTGEYFFKRNEMKNFIPASTIKLITTGTALNYLGQDFKFVTKLFLDGSISGNGEYKGNLIIKGFGDPTLSDNFRTDIYSAFDFWIAQLDSMGIKSIKGNIIADGNYFDDVPYGQGWAWDDMTFPYSAQVSALSFYDNKVDIIIEQGENIGANTKYKITPDNSYVRVINKAITSATDSGEEIEAVRDPLTNVIELYGSLVFDSTKVNRTIKSVAIDQPSLFFANCFKERLIKKNIKFRGAIFNINDWGEEVKYYELVPVADFESLPLSEIIKVINKKSHNLASEILLKTLGKEIYGYGSTERGLEVVGNYLNKIGVQTDKCFLVDGSGLSRLNLISPFSLNTFLFEMYKGKYKEIFRKSLATPNDDGTLKRRFSGTLAEKNLFAKTGSMNNVSSLAGYLYTRDKEVLTYTIMCNNFTSPQNIIRNLQDLICMRLTSFSRKETFNDVNKEGSKKTGKEGGTNLQQK